MNPYSSKLKWKILLFALALIIAGVSMWYTGRIADSIRAEERKKVELWSEAIQRKAELVNFTEKLFESLRKEERKKADLWVKAVSLINSTREDLDLTFVTEVLFSNNTIPVLLYDDEGRKVNEANLPPHVKGHPDRIDSLKKAIESKRPPIEIKVATRKQYLYYDDSFIFAQLQDVMEDLIEGFISETVVNAASVPVIMTDSTGLGVVSWGNIPDAHPEDTLWVSQMLNGMRASNQPIEVMLPVQGRHLIFYADSNVLTQLRFFPIIQLGLIGVFLIVSYLVFSTFRKAEQNRVWVGMAKETAHQLGTPLSSLLAWVEILRSGPLGPEHADELYKDINRLEIITERFSKIGSKPDLTRTDLRTAAAEAIQYLKPRMPGRVKVETHFGDRELPAMINEPLLGWVIENLVKNAVDAMEAEGIISMSTGLDGGRVYLDISDTGKGIPKSMRKTVFRPGYTTKKRGWGLGLSLAKRIVEQYHNGKIFVRDSEPGTGTTFRIILRSGDA
jgi:two-component system, sporulation sensor kinase D